MLLNLLITLCKILVNAKLIFKQNYGIKIKFLNLLVLKFNKLKFFNACLVHA